MRGGFTRRGNVRIVGMNRRILIRFPRKSIRWGRRSLHGHIIRSEPFLLPFSSFVVLEPIKDILAFNLTVLPQPSRDPLNLFCTWGSNSIVVVKVLQYSYLVGCGSPPCTTLPAEKAPFSTATLVVWLAPLWLLRFHHGVETKTRQQKRMLFVG